MVITLLSLCLNSILREIQIEACSDGIKKLIVIVKLEISLEWFFKIIMVGLERMVVADNDYSVSRS